MVDSSYLVSLKHSLWNLLAGTRGGLVRIRMLKLLRQRPYNINQLSEKLSLDYKTVQHHIKVLLDANIIVTDDRKKYGSMYFLSELLEDNIGLFDEIWERIGETNINRKEKDKG
jgi:DNA-binding transcriptional ArsR family regulator